MNTAGLFMFGVLVVVVGNFTYNAILFGMAFLHTDSWVVILVSCVVTAFFWLLYLVIKAVRRTK